MREILFRGKRVDNGEWIEGYLYCLSERHNPFIMAKNKCGESHEVIPETVGQYTGLTDKHVNKIFEGDIVDILTENEEIGVIKYDDNDACFYVDASTFTITFSQIYGKDTEVIGNVHDDLELLGGNK